MSFTPSGIFIIVMGAHRMRVQDVSCNTWARLNLMPSRMEFRELNRRVG